MAIEFDVVPNLRGTDWIWTAYIDGKAVAAGNSGSYEDGKNQARRAGTRAQSAAAMRVSMPDFLDDEAAALHSPNVLVASVNLPAQFAAALGTGREEIAEAITQPLTMEQTRQVAHGFAVLIRTNRELVTRLVRLAEEFKDFRRALNGLAGKADRFDDSLNFRTPSDDGE